MIRDELVKALRDAQKLLEDSGEPDEVKDMWPLIKGPSPSLQATGFTRLRLTKIAGYDDLKTLPNILNVTILQPSSIEISNLKKRVSRLEQRLDKIDRQPLSFEELVEKSPALQAFIKNKELTGPLKNLIIKNKEKIEGLYKDGKFQTNLEKFKGMLEIKDKKIASDFFD